MSTFTHLNNKSDFCTPSTFRHITELKAQFNSSCNSLDCNFAIHCCSIAGVLPFGLADLGIGGETVNGSGHSKLPEKSVLMRVSSFSVFFHLFSVVFKKLGAT